MSDQPDILSLRLELAALLPSCAGPDDVASGTVGPGYRGEVRVAELSESARGADQWKGGD